MQLKPNERRDLKTSYKRLVWFLLGVVLIDAFIAFLLYSYTAIGDVLCGFIIIVITTLLYLVYVWLCSKHDKRKKAKLEKSGKRDPFARD